MGLMARLMAIGCYLTIILAPVGTIIELLDNILDELRISNALKGEKKWVSITTIISIVLIVES